MLEGLFSSEMNSIIESHFIRSTDCMHTASADLLFEIIKVRGVLSLLTWFLHYIIDDVLSNVCV